MNPKKPEPVDIMLDDYKIATVECYPEDDPVNHPSHYTTGKIECIDYILDKELDFCRGNAVKYITRAGRKDPDKEIEDLKKELTALINKNFDSIRDSLPAQDEEGSITLSEVKEDLSEKIHAENVKVFRNIQDTLKEMDLKEEVDLSIEVRYRSLRNRVFWTTSLLLVNVGISVVLLLLYLGVIK